MSNQNKPVCLAILIIILGVTLVTGITVLSQRNKQSNINNYEECVAAGNPIMESYPEKCAANGQTFSNPNQSVGSPTDQVQ